MPACSCIRLVQTNRGGQATYHGPGQLVGYPILDLRVRGQDLHRYLRSLEDMLIALVADYGVDAGRSEGQTGVWIGRKKIASIGVGVRRWISMHGFALNVGGDLAAFTAITPCGIAGVEMTSLSRAAGREIGVREVAERVGTHFQAHDCVGAGGLKANLSSHVILRGSVAESKHPVALPKMIDGCATGSFDSVTLRSG
ncbi:MAG: lipoyl(octanoyl) transferase LipB [Chthoniobacter sp.]